MTQMACKSTVTVSKCPVNNSPLDHQHTGLPPPVVSRSIMISVPEPLHSMTKNQQSSSSGSTPSKVLSLKLQDWSLFPIIHCMAFQEPIEEYLCSLSEDTNLSTIYATHVTIQPKDLALTDYRESDYRFGWLWLLYRAFYFESFSIL